MKYIKEFDTLRAIAVFLVLISHSFNSSAIAHVFPLGFIGVTFFFVLSGYLITNILFESVSIPQIDNSKRLKIFYLRRTLRIFPAYYLFLAINYLFQNPDLIAHPASYYLYFSNIHFFYSGSFAGAVSPTWTLAVEEQFYLIWPFLILFVNKKYLPALILSLMAFSPLFRVGTVVVCKFLGQNPALELSLMPSNLLPLCLGAYIAYSHRYGATTWYIKWQNKVVLFVFLVIFMGATFFAKSFVQSLVQQMCLTVISGWLIHFIATKSGSKSLAWLCNPVTSYLGKISYGIYLYHTIAVSVVGLLFPVGALHTTNEWLEFFISVVSVVSMASASWFLFEGPIHDLKRYFPYFQKEAKKPSLASLDFERVNKPEMIS